MTASGLATAITIIGTADEIYISNNHSLQNIKIDGIANLVSDTPHLVLRRMEALVDTIAARSTVPAKITVKDGVGIENLNLDWGDKGHALIEGQLSQDRWAGRIELDQINIPETDGTISIDLDIDTDRDLMGNGSFVTGSVLKSDNDTPISGEIIWRDGTLHITSTKPDAPLLAISKSLQPLPVTMV